MQINEVNIVLYISIVAAIVSIIAEILKKVLEKLNKTIPPELLVIVTSLIVTPGCYILLMHYLQLPIEWFMVFANFIAAFIVALVSMGGWEKVTAIISKCMRGKI